MLLLNTNEIPTIFFVLLTLFFVSFNLFSFFFVRVVSVCISYVLAFPICLIFVFISFHFLIRQISPRTFATKIYKQRYNRDKVHRKGNVQNERKYDGFTCVGSCWFNSVCLISVVCVCVCFFFLSNVCTAFNNSVWCACGLNECKHINLTLVFDSQDNWIAECMTTARKSDKKKWTEDNI